MTSHRHPIWYDSHHCQRTEKCTAPSLPNYRLTDGVCLREKGEADHDFGYELVKRVAHILMDRLQATRLQSLDSYFGGMGV